MEIFPIRQVGVILKKDAPNKGMGSQILIQVADELFYPGVEGG